MVHVPILEEVAMKHQLIRISGAFCILLLAAMATAGTWSPNNFFYQPSLGARGPAEKNNFDAGLNRVDAHLGKYKTLGDPGYGTLAEALTTIGSSNVTLTIPAGTVTVASNTTIGNNIALRVFKGGQFTVNSGVTLTINGPVDAGPYQIFAGSGAVTLGGVSTIYDVWYAAPPSTPEGVIAAPIGSRFVKTSGSAPLVYVKESGTGNTGWVASSGGSGATSFTGLNDVPHSYSDQAGKALRVKSDTTGLEFYTPLSAFTSLSDVPSSYTGNIGKSLRVNSSGNGLEFYSPAISNIFSASTTPTLTELGYLSGVTSSIQNQLNAKAPSTSGTSLLKGNGSGGFSSAIAGDVNSILPSMTGNSGKFLTNDGTNSSWAAAGNVTGPGSSTDKAITRFSGTGGKTVQNSLVTVDDNGSINIPSGQNYKINNTNLSYSNVGAAAASHTHAATDITSGTLDGDRLGAPTATKRGGVKATGTPSNKFYRDDDTWATPPGATVFTGLADVPSSYGNQAGRAVRVKSDATGLEFFDLPAGVTKAYATLGDSGYTTLAQALTTIGSTSTTLAIPSSAGTISVTSNTTIPANVDLLVFKGARFDVAAGVTLTINGSLEAGPYQIFSWSGTGAINLSSSPTKRCYLEWWGAQPGMTNNITPQLLKAYQSLGGGQDIVVTRNLWRLATTMEYVPSAGWAASSENFWLPNLVGEDEYGSVLYMDVGAANDGIVIGGIYSGNDKWIQGAWIKNLTILGNTNACRHALNLRLWNHRGGTENVNLFCGSADSAVRLAQIENGSWDFKFGFGGPKYYGIYNYAAMKNGVQVVPEPGGWGLGAGTFNRFRVRKTFVSGCTYAFYAESSGNIVLEEGDIETCSDGDVQSHYDGFYDNLQVPLYNGGITRIAQTFTLTQSTTIRNIGVNLDQVNTPHGNVVLKLYNTSGGAPSGTPIYTSWKTYAAGDLNNGNPFQTLFDIPNLTLAAGTYAFSVEFTGGDASNYVNVDVDQNGGGPGNCYTYSGTSWSSQTYTLRHVINANAAVWLYKCTSSVIHAQHLEANWLDYKIDYCDNIEINNGQIGGDINITRSNNIILNGANEYSRIITDPVSSISLQGNQAPLNSDVMQDYGDTLYAGKIRNWFNRIPPNVKGNNPLNYCSNHLLDRWQTDRPDNLAASGRGGWTKDPDMTWTWCGDGKSDTTRHPATPYSAKLVKTTSNWWQGPFLDAASGIAAVAGHHVTASIYLMFPPGQSWSNSPFMNISVSLPAWSASTNYRIGDGMNYGMVVCVSPGQSGATQPNWDSYNDGDYIVDGTVLWLKWSKYGYSGGNIDASWSDGQWRRIASWRFVPLNAINISMSFLWYTQTGGGPTTTYFAMPCFNIGTIPSRSVMPSPNETASCFLIGGVRYDRGTSFPTDGRWCNVGDTRFNSNPATGQPIGWQCVTAGPAGSGASWKPMANLN